ncbi:MAG: hypothetical protein HYY13_13375 [Nitrospirae bacterium]|nr:hypothetical protein [Nitrospirota bacterium]
MQTDQVSVGCPYEHRQDTSPVCWSCASHLGWLRFGVDVGRAVMRASLELQLARIEESSGAFDGLGVEIYLPPFVGFPETPARASFLIR